jgi:hypothetical protein
MREFLTLFVFWWLRQSVTASMQIEICAQISHPETHQSLSFQTGMSDCHLVD